MSYCEAALACHCLSPLTTSLLSAWRALPRSAKSAKLYHGCQTQPGRSAHFPAQGWAWGLEERNKLKLNPAVIQGMLAGSWKTGVKHTCFVAEGCLHLQLQLSAGEGAGFLVVPGGLSSSESGGTFFSFLLVSRLQPQLLDADTAFHQQCSYHLEIHHHIHSTWTPP